VSQLQGHTPGTPKVTAMELSKVFPQHFGKKQRRHRPAGTAPKKQKVKAAE